MDPRILAKLMIDTAMQHPADQHGLTSPALAFLRWAADNIPVEAPDEAEGFAQLIREQLPLPTAKA